MDLMESWISSRMVLTKAMHSTHFFVIFNWKVEIRQISYFSFFSEKTHQDMYKQARNGSRRRRFHAQNPCELFSRWDFLDEIV